MVNAIAKQINLVNDSLFVNIFSVFRWKFSKNNFL